MTTPEAPGEVIGGGFRRAVAFVLGQRRLAIGLLLAALVSGVSTANPAFASAQNLRDLFVQAAPVVIVGCGMTLLVMTGEIDISAGSLLGLLAAVLGCLASPSHLGFPAWLAVGLTVLAGTCAGCVNGVLVAVLRVPSIVATLGMLTVLRGVTEIVLGGVWITDLPPGIRSLGTGAPLGMAWSVWVAAAGACVLTAVARTTRLGVWVRAAGGNGHAAALSGVPVRGVKIITFTLVGFLVGVAAAVCVPQQSVIESGIGVGFELVVVTAVVVGGTSIRGGVGGISGTVVAALLLGSIRTAMVFVKVGDVATYWERAIQGGLILAAVLADQYGTARRVSGPRGAGS